MISGDDNNLSTNDRNKWSVKEMLRQNKIRERNAGKTGVEKIMSHKKNNKYCNEKLLQDII